ncbi:MAG TPA: hypothetical protein VFJ15_10840 [Oleiagrimonas sp.]|nr:hypothetical protein [Oleiagrimonas sp.]
MYVVVALLLSFVSMRFFAQMTCTFDQTGVADVLAKRAGKVPRDSLINSAQASPVCLFADHRRVGESRLVAC